MQLRSFLAAALAVALPAVVTAQLSGTVGPLTSSDTKWATKVCSITQHGAVADGETDISAALLAAFASCSSGGVVSIPSGTWALSTFVALSGGSAWAINQEGTIVRTGSTDSGTMITIEDTTDFEWYSSNGKGAIQGYGYVFHAEGEYGPRLVRIQSVTDFSFHDIALVDAGAFHLVIDTGTNGEVYNVIIRGANEGGLDGVDVWGTNMWIHDVEVTNKDECVTVKSPASHFLIENIYCNWSGGCAIGSLGADTAVSDITYNQVYTVNSNQMMMLKSNGGSGSVSNCVFENFIGHKNAYSLYIDAYWTEETLAAGDGVLYTDLTFNEWHGDCADGDERGPIDVTCPDGEPCTDITIENFAIWTDSGSSEIYKCESAWGSGGCLKAGSAHTSYAASTTTITATPAGWSAATMPSDLASGYGLSTSIPVPALPTTFYPGVKPISAIP